MNFEQIKPYTFSSEAKSNTIFVSIASYRDPELLPTLKDLYAKAKYPSSIRVYCLMQIDENDSFNLDLEANPLGDYSIDFGVIDKSKSKGVCWARTFCQQQHKGEKYILQIDSHMRFAENWDELLIEMLENNTDDKAILSCYPPAFSPDNEVLIPSLVKTRPKDFDKNHTPILQGCALDSSDCHIKSTRHQWISAGFFFTYGTFIEEVPYDPWHYFQGEETDLTLRAYTRNWNVYAPETCVIWHYYFYKEENDRVLHWEEIDSWSQYARLSDERIMYKLNIITEVKDATSLTNISQYEMGDKRSISDFEQEIGIDFRLKNIIQN